jgi:hypothetical protein
LLENSVFIAKSISIGRNSKGCHWVLYYYVSSNIACYYIGIKHIGEKMNDFILIFRDFFRFLEVFSRFFFVFSNFFDFFRFLEILLEIFFAVNKS